MGIELPPINKFVPSLDSPDRLFDMSKDDIQISLSQVLRAAIFLRRKKLYLKKESKRRRIHSVLSRARRLASEYSSAIQDAAVYLDLDQLWDLIENTLQNRIKKLLQFLSNYNDSILKYPSKMPLKSDSVSDGYNESLPEYESQSKDESVSTEIKEDEIEDIPLDMDDMERFVSQNMDQIYDEDGPDLFDSLGEESDGSVAAKDMKFSDFFDPIKSNSKFDKSEIEKELVAPKHWSMRGEVRGKDRPKDSLLELDLDFLYNHKDLDNSTLSKEGEDEPIPLEMIIRQRIESKVFDNVEPKYFSIDMIRQERNADANGEVELDFSKSDRGLADIYAEKYQKEIERINNGKVDELSKDKVEIADLFSKILYKLDSLSNLNFLPMTPINTAKTGDDIVPIIVSVPNDSYVSKEKIKSKSEMTREEKRSLRRLNKEKYSKKVGKSDKDKSDVKVVKNRNIEKPKGKLNTAELLQKKVKSIEGEN